MQLRELLQMKGVPVDRLEFVLMKYSKEFEIANHYEDPELYVEHITALDAVADFLKLLDNERTKTELPKSNSGTGATTPTTPNQQG
jgi:hypothetical protein